MKQYAILSGAFALALASAQAQTVPLFINYQGKITGGTGDFDSSACATRHGDCPQATAARDPARGR